MQIIPELVTNADAAIAASGRASGRIVLDGRCARGGVSVDVASADALAALAGVAVVEATSCAAPMTARASTPA